MTHSDRSDEELLRLYRETQDMTCVVELFKRVRGALTAMVIDIVGNREDALDILSTVQMELLEDLLKTDVRNFGGFAYRKARNDALTFWRRKGRMELVDRYDEKYPDQPVENPDLSSLDQKHKDKAKQILRDCIESLNKVQKTTVNLFYFFQRAEDGKIGMRYKQIESHANLSSREVKTGIETGRRKLKQCLEKHGIRGLDDYDPDLNED